MPLSRHWISESVLHTMNNNCSDKLGFRDLERSNKSDIPYSWIRYYKYNIFWTTICAIKFLPVFLSNWALLLNLSSPAQQHNGFSQMHFLISITVKVRMRSEFVWASGRVGRINLILVDLKKNIVKKVSCVLNAH